MCDRVEGACPTPPKGCRDGCTDETAQKIPADCTSAASAYLECNANATWTCKDGVPQAGTACDAEKSSYFSCMQKK